MKAISRVLAFIGKEILAIMVQPQLLLLLVAGPFLVLLAFGLGYRPRGPELRTIVVLPPQGDAGQTIRSYLGTVGPPIRIVQMGIELDPALQQLRAHNVELVVVVPPDAQNTLLQGKNVQLVFYHNEIDPNRVGYVAAVIDGLTSQLNRAIVKQAVGEQQASTADYERVLTDLQANLADMHTALQQGDRSRAAQRSQAVRLNSGLLASLWLLGADPLAGSPGPATKLAGEARQLDVLLANPQSDPRAADAQITLMQGDVERMLQGLRRAKQIPPDVFVSPLVWEAKGVSAYQPSYVAYHSPTVLALLVQHLCITLAALSLVDERSAGALELFRAAPVTPREIVLGKFLAYLLLIALITTGLFMVLIHGLHVPVLGNWRWLAAIIAALVAHSLTLGFMISAIANSRSQAIQMSMLALLGSIFFSGFFAPLEDFLLPVRLISYSLPVTYGIGELRQVVLRGEAPDPLQLALLAAWAVVLAILSVRLFKRQFLSL